MKRLARLALIASLINASACSPQHPQESGLDVTQIQQTLVKKQSISNCWIYATSGWAEAVHLAMTKEIINISESYLTYWSFYEMLLNRPYAPMVDTYGNFDMAKELFLKYGWMLEEEFIPEEAREAESQRQEKALAMVAEELKEGGRLFGKENRNAENLIKVLDEAFQVDMTSLRQKAHSAKKILVDFNETRWITLEDAFQDPRYAWQTVVLPQQPGRETLTPNIREKRLAMLKRALKALNDKKPVIMSFVFDANALDKDGIFKVDTLAKNGPGNGAGHLVVLTDYTVADVPGVGDIGEGEVSQELKERALKEGRIVTVKAKNSWGRNNPEKGVTDGFNRFELEYLIDNQPSIHRGKKSYKAPMVDLVLPPGY